MSEIINAYFRMIPLMVGVMLFGKIVINKKFKSIINLKSIILFSIVCAIQSIVLVTLNGTIKTVLMLFNNAIFYKFILKTNISKSIFLSFVYMILLIIPDALELIILTKVFNFSKEYCYTVLADSIISNVVISSIMILTAIMLRKILRKLISITIAENIKIIIYYILTFICISIFFYKSFGDIKIDINFLVSIFIIIVFLVILISLIKQTMENNKLSEEYDKLLEFMTTFENEIEKQRVLRHETKNEFLTIRAKICDNQKNKEIVEYIDEILQDKIKVKQEEYAKFGYLPPNGIKGLCYFKVQEAEEKELKVSINISKRITKSTVYELNTKEQRDFGRILGVLLDNAIEASILSEEKQIGIEAYTTRENEFKMIISNTYKNKIDKNKIGKERFSTKGKTRGHGLLLVKHIINKNKIFGLNSKIENNIYTQIIVIKKV